MTVEIWPGRPNPIGATFDGVGTNFCVFSEVAERVELCLFDDNGTETRVDLPQMTGRLWHGYAPKVGAGQRYGYRVYGPWDPARGLKCNPAKLLLDPYARAIDGQAEWTDASFGHVVDADGAADPLTRCGLDSGPGAAKSVVLGGRFEWGDDRPPRTPWERTIIYETHVKGFTARHPGVPEGIRGTYAGLAHPAAVEHLVSLGVTAVELLPVQQFAHDGPVRGRGLTNYWGYNTIGYFAPHNEYTTDPSNPEAAVTEFKHLVKTMHAAGLEVLLDVVYNHTAEGGHEGPTLCFRGLDNTAYYRIDPDDRMRHVDYTGCGNTVDTRHPRALRMIMDSLRYWIEEMRVDGFRFDLCSALAREDHGVDPLCGFFDIIEQDPVIAKVKLIAEPWDLGLGGYQVGGYPPNWSEWNGKYRDCTRDFWRGEASLGEMAGRFTGSADLYQPSGRRPYASVNFVTSHDGFTLRDLVSYNEKHNLANGEADRDGESHNRSWNCGVEGPTDDAEVNALRSRQQRNLLATLLLSQGVPMISHGDEVGRTQGGNNNAYCQDNEVSWIDWEGMDSDLLLFTRHLVQLRKSSKVLQRRHWFAGEPVAESELRDVVWFTYYAEEMNGEHWDAGYAKSIMVFLNGHGVRTVDSVGQRITDDDLLVMMSADEGPMEFTVPALIDGMAWTRVLDTAAGEVELRGPDGNGGSRDALLRAGEKITLESRSIVVLKNVGAT